MAQRHPDSPALAPPTGLGLTAGDALTGYLGEQAAEFLRALRLRGEDEAAGDRLLRASARRISAALHTYEPLVDPVWAESLRTELGWLAGTVNREYRYAAHLVRLRSALHRLAAGEGGGPCGVPVPADAAPVPAARTGRPAPAAPVAPPAGRGPLAVGAARAGALLERQLTLARTRAHSATLQAFGSSRFHAVADAVALLASELPLTAAAAGGARQVMTPLVERARRQLGEAADALPLPAAGHPYNGLALRSALCDTPPDEGQDVAWHRARSLLRLTRYALEVAATAGTAPEPDAARLYGAERALDRHREAADAAAAAAGAARTPRITPATAYALGLLHADQRAEAESARHAFSRLWQGAVAVP